VSEGTRESHLRILKRLSAMLTRIEPPKRKTGIELDEMMARAFPRGYVDRTRRKIEALEARIEELEGGE